MASQLSQLKKPKFRFYFSWIFAAFVAIISKTSTIGFLIGIPVIVLGETLRIWSQGCIEKRTKLTVCGPYAFTRNPLYVSNYLIGLGFILILFNLWIFIAYHIGFFFVYRHLIDEEEKYLRSQYGSSYEDYCRYVPRFFPTWKRYHEAGKQSFVWKLFWKNGEQVTLTAILLIAVSLYLRQIWFQDGSGLFSRQVEVFYLWFLLAAALLFFLLQRKFKKG